MSKQPSILFVCRNFHEMAGGIERMATLMMNEMVQRGFRVGLITWDQADAVPHYELDSSVEWMKLDVGSPLEKAGWGQRFRRQIVLRRMARRFKPDVAIGFQVGTFLAARTAMLGMRIPLIAAERNSPDLFDYVSNGEKLRRRADLVLSMADCITVQLESYRAKYPENLRSRIVSIPNPVSPPDNFELPNSRETPPKRILHVGRLSFQKNQVFLIKAFSRVAASNPDWVLTLVGEGEKRYEIESLVQQLELSGRVELVGAVTDVDKWYSKSSFLAFPSLWEGFPNVLVEAYRHGLPALGFEQTAGVNELLRHKETGLLTECDEAAYAKGLQAMIDDPVFLQAAGRNAQNTVLRYAPKDIFDQWASLFIRLARNGHS